jgi:hypothetical protein
LRRLSWLACALALGAGGVLGGGVAGCGAAGASRTARLREELAALPLGGPAVSRSEAARRSEQALAEVELAEREGRTAAADEHASRARAWAEVAIDEAEASALEGRLGELEVALLDLETEAAGLEHDASHRRRAHQELAAARASREEVQRVLLRAEADEGTPRRSRRLGLSGGPELARMADVLAERARLLLAAAVATGAGAEPAALARDALSALEPISEPLARLAAADRAHGLARAALADARHRRGEAPTAAEIAALEEALASEGFTAFRDDQGLGARLEGVFEGASLAPAARGRLRRLGELLASHPAGPVLLLVDTSADRGGHALATRRLEALRAAVLGDRERPIVVASLVEVRLEGPPAPLTDGARVLLPAYVPRGPAPTTVPGPAAASAGDPSAAAPSEE